MLVRLAGFGWQGLSVLYLIIDTTRCLTHWTVL